MHLSIILKQSIIRLPGPVKVRYVGTNYTPSHNRSYLSIGIEYLLSVTHIIQPIKSIGDENCMSIA